MKRFLVLLPALLLTLALLCGAAAAEEARVPGALPERGVILPMTQEDVDGGLSLSYSLAATQAIPHLPVFDVSYADLAAIEAVSKAYEGKDMTDETTFYAMLSEMISHYYRLFEVALFDSEFYGALREADMDYISSMGDAALELGENGGYTYVAIDLTDNIPYDDEEERQKIVSAALRTRELLENAEFTEIVFPAEEAAAMSGAFPAFETTDLSGNAVTNAIFAGKDLTVVNVWGTYCNPCIEEMPDLAAWSAEMPENVQLIGIVCDLTTLEDADTLELANAICEATGANVYPSLVANETLMPLLSTVVGVPTTFFVDGEGKLVGEAIVGANVPGCRAFVEEYLGAQ